MSVHKLLIGTALVLLGIGACERPQDRPLDPELPAPEAPTPSDSGSPDADTGRTIGPIAEVNVAPIAGSSGNGGGLGGTLGTGGVGGIGTGGRSIH